jgi:hypothetical protein
MKWNRAPQQLNWKMQQVVRIGCVSGETTSSVLRLITGAVLRSKSGSGLLNESKVGAFAQIEVKPLRKARFAIAA